MNVVVFGRSSFTLNSARALHQSGHRVCLVATAKPADYYHVTQDEFRHFADQIRADYWYAPQLNAQEYVNRLRGLGADIAISVNWPALIGDAPIRTFRYGILNAHAGDLPRYRGNACPNWAILNGEDRIGLCIHRMNPDSIDSGPVFLRDYHPLNEQTYIGHIYDWLEKRIPSMFVDVLDRLASGTIKEERQPEDVACALRCYPRRPEDSRIDWREDAIQVHRLIRASSKPFPGAFSTIEGDRRLTIWRADLYQHQSPFLAVPGQVLLRADGDPVIACGRGCIRLTSLSVEGETNHEIAKKYVTQSLRTRLI